jgi:hypothetical protein
MIISKEHQILVNKKISRVLILYSDNVKLYWLLIYTLDDVGYYDF